MYHRCFRPWSFYRSWSGTWKYTGKTAWEGNPKNWTAESKEGKRRAKAFMSLFGSLAAPNALISVTVFMACLVWLTYTVKMIGALRSLQTTQQHPRLYSFVCSVLCHAPSC
ncbi:uncharacterized protein BDW43DRAFT_181337 [Aspergillus alliaceus]|uniref:uncharacterized protein n=1 Tax=Petromyces alliaceus TaxID=209559 RepID=UPI0012A5B51E|nr:uncharacterized protein BDW43DRAFT_181337 [Aspergillus alliaceus]KAB8237679.1 hypothetical protein BDW43DRAFT_181337 [Aspergillus alliaceus]